jgi:HEPN domain-containing protein
MLPMTAALVTKAEMAMATARREMQVTDRPNFDAVAFHSGQCAERYLKASLIEGGITFPDTRHLVVLLHLCLDRNPTWEAFRHHLCLLTTHGCLADAPDQVIPRATAEESLQLSLEFRASVRATMGLPT